MPINPEFLPEAALLLAGVIVGAIASGHLLARRWTRALGLGTIGVACIFLAFSLARTHRSVRPFHAAATQPWRPNPLALTPAGKDSIRKDSETTPSMALMLGDVLLRVAPSDRYVLSVDGKQFLELDSLRSGLTVGCVVARRNDTAAGIGRRRSGFHETGVQPTRLDAHTLGVRERGEDLFRVHYAEPHRIEVTGNFFVAGSREPPIVSFEKGIRWSGGGLPPGTTVDLTRQGKGRIDFERSGLIRILPFAARH
jgi:hypothetical protein